MFNVLLQILDDGRVTDAHGRTVDFKNTVIIMTSNIGSQHLLEGISAAGDVNDAARAAVMQELRQHFRPEFLNRVDDTVLFKTLTLDEIERIVDLLADELRRRLADRDVKLDFSSAARTLIARQGFDPVYGARPLRRFLRHELETRIGRALIGGEVRNGAALRVDVRDGVLSVDVDNPPDAAG